MSIDNNALEKEQGGVIKEFIHWENISEGNRKCLDQIREHFKLTSDFEAICLAIQKLMPALHQVDNLRTNSCCAAKPPGTKEYCFRKSKGSTRTNDRRSLRKVTSLF